MKIAVVTEVSTAAKNKDIMAALKPLAKGHEILNVGLKGEEGEPGLLIYETGFLSALLLNLGCVDFVIGGCGTGQGYFNCVVQFPGVTCGLLQNASDAWLYPRINGGNCASLALNKGYGWAGEINLEFIFEKLFEAEFGAGYPASRREPQKKIREKYAVMSQVTHKPFEQIILDIDEEIFRNTVTFPGVMDVICRLTPDKELPAYQALMQRAKSIGAII